MGDLPAAIERHRQKTIGKTVGEIGRGQGLQRAEPDPAQRGRMTHRAAPGGGFAKAVESAPSHGLPA